MSLFALLVILVLTYVHRDAIVSALACFSYKSADAVVKEVPSLQKHHKAVYMVTVTTVMFIITKLLCLVLDC